MVDHPVNESLIAPVGDDQMTQDPVSRNMTFYAGDMADRASVAYPSRSGPNA
jgi:hypothetical protein